MDNGGYNCAYYKSKGICTANDFHEILQYYGGKQYNFPELNCCECGKKDDKYYQAPSTAPNTCTH